MSNHLVIGVCVNRQDGCATACHLHVSLWPQTVVLHYQYCLTAGLSSISMRPSPSGRKNANVKRLQAAVHLCLMTCWELSQQAFLINKAIKQTVIPRSLPGGVEEVLSEFISAVVKTSWLIGAQVYTVQFCFLLIVSVQWCLHWAVTYAGKCFMPSESQGNVKWGN